MTTTNVTCDCCGEPVDHGPGRLRVPSAYFSVKVPIKGQAKPKTLDVRVGYNDTDFDLCGSCTVRLLKEGFQTVRCHK